MVNACRCSNMADLAEFRPLKSSPTKLLFSFQLKALEGKIGRGSSFVLAVKKQALSEGIQQGLRWWWWWGVCSVCCHPFDWEAHESTTQPPQLDLQVLIIGGIR